MAKDTLIQRLDQAIDALLKRRDLGTAASDPDLAELLAIANDLRRLPRESFKARLKAEIAAAASAPTYTDLSADSLQQKPEQKREGQREEEKETRTVSSKATPAPVYATVTAYLCCRNATDAIEFYKNVFGAKETFRLQEPGGRIGHAELRIGNTELMLADEYPEYGVVGPQSLGGSSVTMHLYVDDVDAMAKAAVEAGATLVRPVSDEFYGDRSGRIVDPFGHAWIIATRKEDLPAGEIIRRYDELMRAESTPKVNPIPPGLHTITPYFQVSDARKLIDFVTRAFGAEEMFRVPMPDGSIIHAEVRIGDSMIEVADAGEQYKAMPGAIHYYVEDTDAVYRRAIDAGGISLAEPVDQAYGERSAGVRDPVGNNWYIATPLEGPPVPEGSRSVTPFLQSRGADKLIDFMQAAFNADIEARYPAPDGTVAHAKVRIGDSIIELGEAHAPWGPMPTALHVYVNDTDAHYRNALAAGAVSMFEPRDEHYGDRVAGVTDQSDNIWYIATHTKDVPHEQLGIAEPKKVVEPGRPIRKGFNTVTPYLTLEQPLELVEFCKRAFGAVETARGGGGAGGIHCEVRIGDSMVMIGGGPGVTQKFPGSIYLYVEDVDALYKQALEAGATSIGEPKDQPYGDRCGGVRDPFGNEWYLATHLG
jgi:PhnB protein